MPTVDHSLPPEVARHIPTNVLALLWSVAFSIRSLPILAVSGSIGVALAWIFHWPLHDLLNDLRLIPIWLFLFLAIVLVCLANLVLNVLTRPLLAVAPALLLTLVLWGGWTGVVERGVILLNYQWNDKARRQIVERVDAGELPPSRDAQGRLMPGPDPSDYEIVLPSGYHHLSSGGRVGISQRDGTTEVTFFATRGPILDYSGYAYRSDGIEPSHVSFERLNGHWFFVWAN